MDNNSMILEYNHLFRHFKKQTENDKTDKRLYILKIKQIKDKTQ